MIVKDYIDESIMKPEGEPIEYIPSKFDGSVAPRGLVVEEVSMSEFLRERLAQSRIR